MPDSNLADLSVFTSTFYNTYIRQQVIVTCTSGTRPTGVEGRVIYETDTDLMQVYSGAAWAPFAGPSTGWATYTSTITQGASVDIAKTTNYSKYTYTGAKSVTWNFQYTMTATGSAGTQVTLTLPVTAASTASITAGDGSIFDAGAPLRYPGCWVGVSTTTIALITEPISGWGGTPSIGLQSSDEIRGSVTYEVA